jgi:hypothetical protein
LTFRARRVIFKPTSSSRRAKARNDELPAKTLATSTRPTIAEISLQALAYNLKRIRRKIGKNVKVMGVVKANAYGHGLTEVSRFLEKQSIDYLGVANAEEGAAVREAGVQTPIHVFTLPSRSQTRLFGDFQLASDPTDHRRDETEAGIVGGMAQHHDKRAFLLLKPPYAGVDQGRSDPLSLEFRGHRDRSEVCSLDQTDCAGNHDRAEEDVADDLFLHYGHKG